LLIARQSDAVDKALVPVLSRDHSDGNRGQPITSQRRWFGDIWDALMGNITRDSNNNNSSSSSSSSNGNNKNNISGNDGGTQKATSVEKSRMSGVVRNQNNSDYFHFPYGEPDTFFDADRKQQHNLALPMNVRGNKEPLRLLLDQFLNSNALADNVMSTHPVIVEQVASSFASHDSEYKGTRMFQQTLKPKHAPHDTLNCSVRTSVCSSFLLRDFDETKVRITDLDFEAFVRLHSQHIHLDYSSLFQNDKDTDQLKKEEYEFYLKLPSAVLFFKLPQKTMKNFQRQNFIWRLLQKKKEMDFKPGLDAFLKKTDSAQGLLVLEESGLCIGCTGTLRSKHAVKINDLISKTKNLLSNVRQDFPSRPNRDEDADSNKQDNEEPDDNSQENEEEEQEFKLIVIGTKKKNRVVFFLNMDGLYVVMDQKPPTTIHLKDIVHIVFFVWGPTKNRKRGRNAIVSKFSFSFIIVTKQLCYTKYLIKTRQKKRQYNYSILDLDMNLKSERISEFFKNFQLLEFFKKMTQ
ncbi:hypothetical protein RFI_25569, partial [Reticulomyxa filosa]